MGRVAHRSRLLLIGIALLAATTMKSHAADRHTGLQAQFHTSDRCLACHNGLTTPEGKDVSIGFDWRSSIMGNSARDPYWQASVRREDIDHPESKAEIEDGCADCHMPMARYEAKQKGKLGEVFAHLPFDKDPEKNGSAEDGVTCSICHQIAKQNFGTRESFNGGFLIETPQSKNDHPEFGPFVIQNAQASIMQTSTGGFRPAAGEQTPLMVAAKANHPDVVRALVAAGADPKLKAQDGSTLLMSAVGSGHVEIVKYVYELDPDVKAVTTTLSTVMHASVTGTMANSTQPEICKVIQFLADKGAPLDERDARGKTPIDLADPLPIDQAIDLLTDLIHKSGATPKTVSKR